jgi:hypothetical protein
VERIEGASNYSRLNNRGVELSRGSFVALLNNDVEVINYDWLSEMVSRVMQPGVAMVGAQLWYPNGAIQHGGVILGTGGIAGHAHVGLTRDDSGYFARAHLAQNLSAVTAACAVVKREVYLQPEGSTKIWQSLSMTSIFACGCAKPATALSGRHTRN